MEAKELRIGNWVYPNEENATPYRVCGVINEEMVDFGLGGFNKRVKILASELEPIELTPEILEKIGKKKEVLGSSDTLNYYMIGGFLYCESDTVLNRGLHWLQNYHYFRTGGEELEIKL